VAYLQALRGWQGGRRGGSGVITEGLVRWAKRSTWPGPSEGCASWKDRGPRVVDVVMTGGAGAWRLSRYRRGRDEEEVGRSRI